MVSIPSEVSIPYWFYIVLMACFGYCIGFFSYFVWEVVKDIAND